MSSEDSFLDLEGSDDEDSHQIPGDDPIGPKNPSKVSLPNKAESSDKSTSGPVICGFCHKPSTLKIGGKSYLCNSRTMPHLRICNACKSYEYRHGILIDRDQRKNKSRKRRMDSDGPSRKRQYYDPVEENPQEIESEPELYPFARTDTPTKKKRITNSGQLHSELSVPTIATPETVQWCEVIRLPEKSDMLAKMSASTHPPPTYSYHVEIRTLPKPPATFRKPVLNASPKKRNVLDWKPKLEKDFSFSTEPKKKLPLSMDDHMDIEGDSENDDLGCEQCKKTIAQVSQLIMCGGCDKIFHKDCYALERSDYTILRSSTYGCRSLTITCADHEFVKKSEKPRSLPPLTIIDHQPTKPNLTLSDLCFDSILETNVVITPDYANQFYNYKNFVETDEKSLQALDAQKMNEINPFLYVADF